MRQTARDHLDAQLAETPAYKPKADMLEGKWSSFVWPASREAQHSPDTGVETEVLQSVGKASVTLPPAFVSRPVHRRMDGPNRLRRTCTSACSATLRAAWRASSLAREWTGRPRRRSHGARSCATGTASGFRARTSGECVLAQRQARARLTVRQGTFSHRHAMFVDQETEQVVVPLNESGKRPGDGMLELANSASCRRRPYGCFLTWFRLVERTCCAWCT